MDNPYTPPDTEIGTQPAPQKVSWLWTIYNSLNIFNLSMMTIHIATGDYRATLVGIITADPGYTDDAPLEELVAILAGAQISVLLLLVVIGYLLVWRVNRRNTWALYTLSAFSFLWLVLLVYSFLSTANIDNVSMSLFDYVGILVNSVLLIALGLRPHFGWRTRNGVT